MYADFMIFFTYDCFVRDDLIKKFKPANNIKKIYTDSNYN